MSAPEKLMELFDEEQISLLVYNILHTQVNNGGFLQLIFNGHANYVFKSPLSQSLQQWGANGVAKELEEVAERCLEVAAEMAGWEKTLEQLSESYRKYPDFEMFDARFYKNDGIAQVKKYVEAHLADFIVLA